MTAEVIAKRNGYEGDIIIPETVVFNNLTYRVASIGTCAFSGNSALVSITIPNSVTSIGNEAFYGCENLAAINVESGNPIYDSRENCNAIIETSSNTLILGCQNTIIPNSVISIGEEAFFECSNLTSITIPNSITSIGDFAFDSCSKLTSLTIPNSVKSIGEQAFCGCKALTAINVESGNSIYDSRENCNAIIETGSNTLILGCQNTIIPDGVINIGESAFYECSNLTSVIIPNSVTNIDSDAFHECSNLTSVTIPNSVTYIGYWSFKGCKSLTAINVESGNPIYDSRENCNAIIETSSNTLILGCQNTIIPDGVINIGEGAFYECSNLTSVIIPNSVTNIDSEAFFECSNLTSVTIPNSVTNIGHWSFKGCSNLISTTIPNSVKNIGDSAFSGCTSLTSIIYQGTKAQLKKIEFLDGWNEEIPTSVVHCTDGDVEFTELVIALIKPKIIS